MKRLFLFVSILVLTSCIKEQFNIAPNQKNTSEYIASDSYYWYRGEKIPLQESSDKVFAIFDRTSIYGFKDSETKSSIIQLVDSRPYCSSPMIFGEQVLSENIAWAKVDKDFIASNVAEILYSAPYYITETGREVGLTNYFLVRLNSVEDYKKLEKFVLENQVTIVDANERSLWYTLACGSHSVSNALQLANKAYESGDFAATDIVFENDFEVVAANPDYNDLYYSQQWNLTGDFGVNLTGTHSITTGQPNIKVAVIDNGFQLNHPDMPVVSSNSWDATSRSSPAKQYLIDGKSYNNHGIGVASIIGAKVNNEIGIVGLAPNVTMLPISVDFSISTTDTTSHNPLTSLSYAIEYAVAAGADVINNSWSHNLYHEAIYIELNSALTNGREGKGSVVVFASGNDSSMVTKYPAILHDKIVIVGGIDRTGKRRESSNYSDKLDLVAPGGDIPILADMGTEDYASGTSFSAPHVSAIAGLMLSVNPQLTNSQVSEILARTAVKLPDYDFSSRKECGTWNVEVGYGLVDCYSAVCMAQNYFNRNAYCDLVEFDYSGTEVSFDIATNDDVAVIWDWDDKDITIVPRNTQMTVEHTYTTSGTHKVVVAEFIMPDGQTSDNSTALKRFDLPGGDGLKTIDVKSVNSALEYVRVVGGSGITGQTICINSLESLTELYLVNMPDVQVEIENCPLLRSFGSSRHIWGAPTLSVVVPIVPGPGIGDILDPNVVGGGSTTPAWPNIPESVLSYRSLCINDCPKLTEVSLENVGLSQFDFSDFPNMQYLYVSSHNDRIVGGTSNSLTMTSKGEFLANTVATLPTKGILFKGKILVRGVNLSNTEYVEARISTKYQNQITTFAEENNWNVVWDSGVILNPW